MDGQEATLDVMTEEKFLRKPEGLGDRHTDETDSGVGLIPLPDFYVWGGGRGQPQPSLPGVVHIAF